MNNSDKENVLNKSVINCQAGHMAVRKAKQGTKDNKNGVNTEVECYYFDVEKCKRCPFRDGCYKDGAKSKNI